MRKNLFFVLIIGVLIAGSGFTLPARAASLTQSQIDAIISLLQSFGADQTTIGNVQSALSGTPTSQTAAVWCHDFKMNLGVEDASSEVSALKTALQKEGFDSSTSMRFDEETASAVSGFQQKYLDEILTPSGLKYGTGYVGKATRAKLNKLYGCGVSLPAERPVQTCKVFLTCETGYRPQNIGARDSQGCPMIKCVSIPTPVSTPISVPVISEQVKCLFHDSTSKQECYSSSGSSCADISACVVDVKGAKGEQITWKSTCGGYAYTTMDSNNEYAEFKCAASATPTPTPTPTPTQTQTPIPTTPKSVVSPSTIGTGTRRFKPIDPSRCPGIIETSCTIEPANIIKVSVYDEKGGFIDTRENNNSGMAGFLNLPYGNYTVVISAEGFEYYKASFTVCATCEETTTIFLKKISTPSTIPSITILSPNGGETLTGGSTQIIKWNSQNVSRVYIKLRKGSDTYPDKEAVVSNIMPNQGFYKWPIPSTLPEGKDYAIRIVDADNLNTLDDSDAAFSIVAAGTPTTPTITVLPTTANQPPTITEVSGPNALTMYENGRWTVKASDPEQGILTYSVSWGDSQQTASGYYPAVYTQTATFSHIYDYTGTYQLVFTVTDNKGLSAKTSISVNVGEVPPPSITIISPNGGEVFKLGSTYNVMWKSTNVTRVVLDLMDSTGKILIYRNLANVEGNPGSASWTIPTYTEPGQYRMRVGTCSLSVTNCANTGSEDLVIISDLSDAVFSIVSIIY